MQITFRKTGDRMVETTAYRDDGVVVELRRSSRPSELPHDLGHYAVDAELGLGGGLWGCIARGALFPGMNVASGRRHSSAIARSQAVIRATHPERGASEILVKAFRVAAEIKDSALRSAELVSPEVRRWFPAHVDKDTGRRIVERLRILESRWQELSLGESMTVLWPSRRAGMRPPSSCSGGPLTRGQRERAPPPQHRELA